MKEQIIQTEPNQVNTERERYGRPIRASVGRLRGRNGTDFTHSTLKVCHRLPEEQLPPHPQRRRAAHGKGVADSVGGIPMSSSEENYFAKIATRSSRVGGPET